MNWAKVNYIRFPNWAAIVPFLANAKGWVYRGQHSFSRTPAPLQTSLERAAAILSEAPSAIETRTYRDFMRRAALAGERNLPKDSDTVEWLALLQHHGAPTRLLDFTYSLYVALFFAVEKSRGDAEIWCIRRDKLSPNLQAFWTSDKNLALESLIDPDKAKGRRRGTPPGPAPRAVFWAEPFYLNKRLSLQQGCFLVPFDVSVSFMDNLISNDTGLRDGEGIELRDFTDYPRMLDIFCIQIPHAEHPDIRKELRRMNMTREHLFPGMDGLGMSFWQEDDPNRR